MNDESRRVPDVERGDDDSAQLGQRHIPRIRIELEFLFGGDKGRARSTTRDGIAPDCELFAGRVWRGSWIGEPIENGGGTADRKIIDA